MPSFVIADLLGIPLDDGVALYQLTETIHAAPESQAPGGGDGRRARDVQLRREVWERQAGRARRRPGHAASPAPRSTASELDDIDFNLFFLLLVDAGGDTTRNLVAGGMLALFDAPRPAGRLRADLDGLLAPAVEEMLRWVSPVVYMRRTATGDTELGGTPIAAGDKVVMYYGSANRDPEAFADPDRSTSRAPRTSTSPSAAAGRTSASAPTSPASRSTRCCASCSPACPTSSPPGRRSGCRRPSSPARSTCRCGSRR